MNGFHSGEGWTWERLNNGFVRVYKNGLLMTHFSPESWASIIASVSKGGESNLRFYAALDFHNSEGAIDIAPKDELNVKGNY